MLANLVDACRQLIGALPTTSKRSQSLPGRSGGDLFQTPQCLERHHRCHRPAMPRDNHSIALLGFAQTLGKMALGIGHRASFSHNSHIMTTIVICQDSAVRRPPTERNRRDHHIPTREQHMFKRPWPTAHSATPVRLTTAPTQTKISPAAISGLPHPVPRVPSLKLQNALLKKTMVPNDKGCRSSGVQADSSIAHSRRFLSVLQRIGVSHRRRRK